MKKKLLYALITAGLLSLAGCGNGGSNSNKSSETGKDSKEVTEETDKDSTAVTEGTGKTSDVPYMAQATPVKGIDLTDEILEKGILNPGNPYRLKEAMDKAANGEPLTIAYIGGSITQGSNASSTTGSYAYLSYSWWEDTFPDSEITYINAGIGGTDSWLGVHRLGTDVLAYKPDIVIVEFSVNDGNTINKETYDSLIRELLESESEPAVLALLLAHENGSYAKEHAPVAFKYQIPIISYSAILTNGLVPWKSVGDSDGVHPKDTGHRLISYLLTSYFRDVMSGKYDDRISPYSVPDITDSATKCRYSDSEILYSDDFFRYDTDSFTKGKVWSVLSNDNGWSTENAGSITFHIKSSEAGIIYMKTNTAPEKNDTRYDVYLDGKNIGTIEAYDKNTWGQHLEYFPLYLEDTASAVHIIMLTPSADNKGTDFTVMGIGVSGYEEP